MSCHSMVSACGLGSGRRAVLKGENERHMSGLQSVMCVLGLASLSQTQLAAPVSDEKQTGG